MKPADGTPFEHTNGTVGWSWCEDWCFRCVHDAQYSDEDPQAGCQILARSLAFSPGEPEYPAEWVYQNGRPVCTAYISVTTVRTKQCAADCCTRRIRHDTAATLCQRCELVAAGQQNLFDLLETCEVQR
jgi:hypothetical protein